jgi:hypothetical protein
MDAFAKAVLEVSQQSPYGKMFSMLEKRFPTELADLRTRLRDRDVIDVGGGEDLSIEKFVLHAGARKYVNVDIRPHTHATKSPKVEYVHADIMKYLSAQNVMRSFEGGAQFVVSGFDGVGAEIDAASFVELLPFYMKREDCIFGVNSPDIAEELEKSPDFTCLVHDAATQFYIFQLR